jgi:hypothetical protein
VQGYTAVPSATFTTREQNIMDNMQALFSRVQTRFIYFSEGDWNTTRSGFIDKVGHARIVPRRIHASIGAVVPHPHRLR